jgi:hypothetical protein
MESNEVIRNQIFEIIKNQLKSNKPYISNLNKLPEEPFDD